MGGLTDGGAHADGVEGAPLFPSVHDVGPIVPRFYLHNVQR